MSTNVKAQKAARSPCNNAVCKKLVVDGEGILRSCNHCGDSAICCSDCRRHAPKAHKRCPGSSFVRHSKTKNIEQDPDVSNQEEDNVANEKDDDKCQGFDGKEPVTAFQETSTPAYGTSNAFLDTDNPAEQSTSAQVTMESEKSAPQGSTSTAEADPTEDINHEHGHRLAGEDTRVEENPSVGDVTPHGSTTPPGEAVPVEEGNNELSNLSTLEETKERPETFDSAEDLHSDTDTIPHASLFSDQSSVNQSPPPYDIDEGTGVGRVTIANYNDTSDIRRNTYIPAASPVLRFSGGALYQSHATFTGSSNTGIQIGQSISGSHVARSGTYQSMADFSGSDNKGMQFGQRNW